MIRSKLLDRIKMLSSRAEGANTSNRITKSFFRFTYKKYRFYFGIFILCNQFYDTKLPAPNNLWSFDKSDPKENDELKIHKCLQRRKECTIPSPFIMSRHRRACIMHQHSPLIHSHNIETVKTKSTSSKITESERCFQKWRNKTTISVKSSRLGISYKTHINATRRKYIRFTPSGYMYQKVLSNYEIDMTYKSKTLKKQEHRRTQAENRLFRTNTENAITSKTKKLFVARRHNLLFTPTQQIAKTIHHL
jgi:hypothetical protein